MTRGLEQSDRINYSRILTGCAIALGGTVMAATKPEIVALDLVTGLEFCRHRVTTFQGSIIGALGAAYAYTERFS